MSTSAPAAAVPQTWPQVAVVNTPSSGVSDADAAAMTAAVQKQVLDHFGPIWHLGAHISFVPSTEAAPAGKWCVALLDNSDQAGALGYHDLTPDGLPLGKVFAGTDLKYGSSVSVTLSHEVLEMLADPWINLSAQAANGDFYAWEVSDAVEDDSLGYEIDGILVSAFVTPAWFGNGAGPLTYPADLVTKPLQLATGGYISLFQPTKGGGWKQSSAQLLESIAGGARQLTRGSAQAKSLDPDGSAVEKVARQVAAAIPKVGSRRERRFRGHQLWVPSTYETV